MLTTPTVNPQTSECVCRPDNCLTCKRGGDAIQHETDATLLDLLVSTTEERMAALAIAVPEAAATVTHIGVGARWGLSEHAKVSRACPAAQPPSASLASKVAPEDSTIPAWHPMMGNVLKEVARERERQESKWGQQNHHPFTYLAVLGEEVGEANQAALQSVFGGMDWPAYRKELVQIAAVAVAMVECFDRGKRRVSAPDPKDCPKCHRDHNALEEIMKCEEES